MEVDLTSGSAFVVLAAAILGYWLWRHGQQRRDRK
jgi:hypothetical protein